MSKINEATGFYNSKAWKDTRRNYTQSVGGLCECCMKDGIIRAAEVVHHKEPLTESNVQNLELSLGWGNLQALCRECHEKAHEAQKRRRRYHIAKDGRIIIMGE